MDESTEVTTSSTTTPTTTTMTTTPISSISSSIKCAPSRNLNTGFLHFPTAKEMYDHLREITKPVRLMLGVLYTLIY
jgi:hypothetical protein